MMSQVTKRTDEVMKYIKKYSTSIVLTTLFHETKDIYGIIPSPVTFWFSISVTSVLMRVSS